MASKRVALCQPRADVLGSGKTFNLVPFASGPYDVDDGVGDGRPYLVLFSYEAATVRPGSLRIPESVERIFTQQGSQGC